MCQFLLARDCDSTILFTIILKTLTGSTLISTIVNKYVTLVEIGFNDQNNELTQKRSYYENN